MKLSICTLAYLGIATLEDSVRRVASFGYDAVDLWAYSPHLDPSHYDKKEREAVRKFVEDLGLEISGISLPGPQTPHLNPSHPSKKVREDAIQYYMDCVELALDIGAPFMPTVTGRLISGVSHKQGWNWYKECIMKTLDRIGERDLALGIHPLPPAESEIVVTTDDALEMIEEIGSEKLTIALDCAVANQVEPNFSDVLRKVAGHLGTVHVGDNDGTARGGPVHCPPGTGIIHWHTFIGMLKEMGYDDYLQVQVFEHYPLDMDAWVIESREYLTKVLKDLGGVSR